MRPGRLWWLHNTRAGERMVADVLLAGLVSCCGIAFSAGVVATVHAFQAPSGWRIVAAVAVWLALMLVVFVGLRAWRLGQRFEQEYREQQRRAREYDPDAVYPAWPDNEEGWR